LEFRRNKVETANNPKTYPPRYVEDFLDISNKVAVKLSKCAVEGLFTTLLVSMKK